VARHKSPVLTEVELEFMKIIWDAREATTDEIRDQLRKQGRNLAGGSVRKIVSILEAKGYVERRGQGRPHVYRPKVLRDSANNRMVLHLLKRAFDGSVWLMVAALLDCRTVSGDELEQIKTLLSKHEKADRK
jgi:BlaI family transcriptional regulator, penicillinase repressor